MVFVSFDFFDFVSCFVLLCSLIAALEADAASYFWVHHTRADTLDKVSEPDFARAVATLAVYAYCVAESDLPPANLTFGGL